MACITIHMDVFQMHCVHGWHGRHGHKLFYFRLNTQLLLTQAHATRLFILLK